MKRYFCPMCPGKDSDHPGDCWCCGMVLEPMMITQDVVDPEYKDLRLRLWLGSALTVPLIAIAMMPGLTIPGAGWLQIVLSTPVVFWAGWPFFAKAWMSVVHQSLNMFSLIALGISTAYLFSLVALTAPELLPATFHHQGQVPLYFETAAVITVLVLAGQVIETKARTRTSQAIQALLDRAAKSTWIVRDGKEQEVPIQQVRIGDILRVRPGEKVAVDGSVIEGNSYVDEAMISGEAVPVKKTSGDPVIGGTINQTGSFLMRAERVGDETLLWRITQQVADAQRSRAPIQTTADQVASYFVPAVVVVAVLTFLVWAFWGPEPSLSYAIFNAVAVLMIACPCALGLATPMSLMVGMGRGAELGILIRNAKALEKLESVTALVVDKTGTLTEGKPRVTNIQASDGWREDDLLRFAAAVETHSEHPIGRAIVQAAQERSLSIPQVEHFQSTPGAGVEGIVEDHRVFVGKPLADVQEQTQTTIAISMDGELAGHFAIGDPIKATAPEAMQELRRLQIQTILLSGDQERITAQVAKKLHLDQYRGGMSSLDKQMFVKELQGQQVVAMAGDGINDAPALAAADVGIAMGTGTDIAIESGDITLVKGNLMGIVRSIHLSRTVMKNIRQNLFFAFIYNIAGIPLAAGILYPFTGWLLHPMIAAAAMSLSSVSVILNALRLRRTRI